jgi:hypothetical protein
MVSLSGLVGFVAIVGESTILAFPRVTLKPINVEVKGKMMRLMEPTVGGLSTWDTEGKTDHDALVKKVKQFGEFFDPSIMVREEVTEKPDGMVNVVAVYRYKGEEYNTPEKPAETVKGAKVVK